MIKRLITVISAVCMAVLCPVQPVSGAEELEDMPAASIAVYECTTGTELFGKNSHDVMPVSHMAKLMTLLIVAEKLDAGEISLTDEVTVSDHAASMQGVTIWLERGEKMTLEELVKAISIGNANDAAVALAEHISGTEESFTALMNARASDLGLEDTRFADSTGMSESTVSTAADLALLCCELEGHEMLRPYLTAWMDTVRGGKAELVNHDRLVRSYKGITGLKACVSDAAGECAAVSARKEYLRPVVVVLGADTQQNCMDIAKILLDKAFEGYSLYTPELEEDMLLPIPVTGGTVPEIGVTFGELAPRVIVKGSSRRAEMLMERFETLSAPVQKGIPVGTLTVKNGDDILYTAPLLTAEEVPELGFFEAFRRLFGMLSG